VLRLRSRRFSDRLKVGNVIEAAELGGVFVKHGSDPAIQLQIGDRLSFRRIGLMDALHFSLEVRERPFLLDMNRLREKDVGDVVQRMVRIPRHHDEELRFAQIRDNRGIARALAEHGVGDEDDVDAVGAVGQQIFDR